MKERDEDDHEVEVFDGEPDFPAPQAVDGRQDLMEDSDA